MSNAFASAIFLARNTEKVQHGDLGRAPVVAAQAGSFLNKVSELDNSIGKSTKTAIDAFEKSTNVSFGTNALNTAGKLVNPLLVAAAGLRVATSDDKEASLYKEAGAMTVMFAAEKAMKSNLVKEVVRQNSDDLVEVAIKGLSKVIKPLENISQASKNKVLKASCFILSGIAFVGASILGYDIGAQAGESAIKKKREKNETKAAENNTKAPVTPSSNNFLIKS